MSATPIAVWLNGKDGASRPAVHGYPSLSGKAEQSVLARTSRQNGPSPAALKPRG
jgi:hypothetical protein